MIADVRDAELARRPSVKINIYKPDEYGTDLVYEGGKKIRKKNIKKTQRVQTTTTKQTLLIPASAKMV